VSPSVPTKVIAASAGLSGFAVGLIAGLASDNPAEVILARALVALIGCQIVGWVVGIVGERVIRSALAQHESATAINISSTTGSVGAVDIKGASSASS